MSITEEPAPGAPLNFFFNLIWKMPSRVNGEHNAYHMTMKNRSPSSFQ